MYTPVRTPAYVRCPTKTFFVTSTAAGAAVAYHQPPNKVISQRNPVPTVNLPLSLNAVQYFTPFLLLCPVQLFEAKTELTAL